MAAEEARKSPVDPRKSTVEARFYTLEDVAAYLAVSTAQAYALVRSGELPAIKVGGRGVWRVDKGQLEAYVERLQEETAAWARRHPLGPKEEVPKEDVPKEDGPEGNGSAAS